MSHVPEPETWVARDGTLVTIRAIRAADFDLERKFADQLSPASRYQRLMSARRLSSEDLRRFTDIDYDIEMALIATVLTDDPEREVGVARYVQDKSAPGQAEFAIVLADDWQHHGLGRKLLSSLFSIAAQKGIRRIVGMTLTANDDMLALARRMGFQLELNPASDTVTLLTLDLAQSLP
jgi:acetyltransferase